MMYSEKLTSSPNRFFIYYNQITKTSDYTKITSYNNQLRVINKGLLLP